MNTIDFSVMKTADDAARAKQAAVQAGYYEDQFVAAFAPAVSRPMQVIIKRGTFARVACVEKAIKSFIQLVRSTKNPDSEDDEELTPQVVLLGAGKDTTFFRLLQMGALDESDVGWFEIDHDDMLREKVSVIKKKSSTFHAKTSRKRPGVVELSAKQETPWPATCHLVSHDLREDTAILLDNKLVPLGLNRKSPTLIVMECVQMYLPVETVDSIMTAFLSSMDDCQFCSYEPILKDDSFGHVMERNLTKARLIVPEACLVERRSITDMLKALQRAGAKRAIGCDMLDAYNTILSADQRKNASTCEFLDELEEWTLIMKHYSFLVATNNSDSTVGKQFCSIGETSTLGFQAGKSEGLNEG